ncbi:WXG100 family type VII secretion target [Spirilliplanes yamanashiensis]|uniref:ESAT-6-like protein n=1 Tax=Spirilliplanes yamanashiensis TaxID=42233 RepID=A0A8J3Y764_9ACTN|nr:WXG100 family type VII secretion target [Spirilliplanes yamanashiensis]MDP9817285.1 WXG100 family type VII secretion target [Spirilliplanes yamanashiensis]GIJ03063.1 hypothetical protein Sya03_24150 [Spirilliplanes yamanashiensis]
MTTYTFDFAMASATIDKMTAVNGNIREALNNLERTCQTTMADWTDDSKDAYVVQKARWDRNAETMNQALISARQALLSISDGYGGAQRSATNLWQGAFGG